MDNEQKQACGAILHHYGDKMQEFQAVQELSELICVLTRRANQRTASYKSQVIDEIADCEIMLEQVKQMHAVSDDELAERIAYKINRQLERIQGETKCIQQDL